MPSIEEFVILEPPTSEEVAEKALAALTRGDGLFDLIIAGSQAPDSPQEDLPQFPEEITFHIQKTQHPVEGGMIISGSEIWLPREERSSYKVVTNKNDPSLPASLSIVRP